MYKIFRYKYTSYTLIIISCKIEYVTYYQGILGDGVEEATEI